jgi:ComF family protein
MPVARRSWSSFSERVLDLLFPRKCALCDVLADEPICGVCLSDFRETTHPYRPNLDGGPLDFVCSLYAYEGRAAQAVRRLKYSRATSLVGPLSRWMLEGYERHGLAADAIVPIPIHWSRRCLRGFNQAELLSERLPAELLRPDLLARVKATRPQVGLSREERLRNLAGAFRASPAVRGMSILLIDDVVTSGHTATECASELRRCGATEVGVLALTGEAR